MNYSTRFFCLLAPTALWAGCSVPCQDDGWLQDEGNDCAALSETDSSGETETATVTETETNSETATDTAGSCGDGVQNGDETDIDCGGSCPNGCGTGQGCGEDDDCVSMDCLPDMTCGDNDSGTDSGGSCEDGEMNGDETDVDCGGSCGPTCENGEMCLEDGDCISDGCDTDAGICVDPSCEDGEMNGDETDVDCGGSCGPTCDTGEMCNEDGDCISDNCGADGTCVGGEGDLWCADMDDDGFGDPDDCTMVPKGDDPPDGTVNNDDDCDDMLDTAFPGAAPNDDMDACMEDKDDDDWGDDDPTGPDTEVGTDCDDDSANAAQTFPGAAPLDDMDACMEDKDDDDYGDDDPDAGGAVPGTDCDDDSAAADQTFPGAAPNDGPGCYEDKDDDDWGDDDPTDAGAQNGTDCDDDSAAAADTFPGAAPLDDMDACMEDEDGDDWGDDAPTDGGTTPGADCDDSSDTTFPGAAENDDANACMKDDDDDGWGDDSPPPGVTAGSDCDEDGEPPCALVVTQDGTLDDTYDQGLEEVLDGLGYVTTAVSDTAAVLSDADGFTVLVISETAESGDIGGTYEDALVPTVCLEGFVWDNMSMAPAGNDDPEGDMDILDAGDPLAGGLAGTVTVISGGGSGQFFTNPPAGALEIGSIAGNATQVTYFAFDEGDSMLGGFVAPRRRVGLGYDADQSAGAVTIEPDGQTLFEAAVDWVTQ